MTSTVDDAKTELKAALLNLLESGVSLNKIRMAPLCCQFQLSCQKDKAGKVYEEILKESGVEQFLMDYLKRKLDQEVISEMASRKQASPRRKPRRKAQAPEQQPGKEKAALPDSRSEQKSAAEPLEPTGLFVVSEARSPHDASEPAPPQTKGRMSGPDRSRPDLQSITPASSSSRKNDNGSSLEEAMSELTDAFHTFSTSEPSLLDVAAVTRYLRSATTMANARAAS